MVVVGIGADGWPGLDASRRSAVEAAEVVLGGERHLGLLPDGITAERRVWPSPLGRASRHCSMSWPAAALVALASGDPLVSGIGSTLVELLGRGAVEILPAVSSVALAAPGWAGRPRRSRSSATTALLARHLAPGTTDRRALDGRLDPGRGGPAAHRGRITVQLMTVLGDLGADDERRVDGVAAPGNADVPRAERRGAHLDGVAAHAAGHLACPTTSSSTTASSPSATSGPSALRGSRPAPGAALGRRRGRRLDRDRVDARAPDCGGRRRRGRRRPRRPDRPQRRPPRRPAAPCGQRPRTRRSRRTSRHPTRSSSAVARPTRSSTLPGRARSRRTTGRRTGSPWRPSAAGGVVRPHGGELTRISVEHAQPLGAFTGWAPCRHAAPMRPSPRFALEHAGTRDRPLRRRRPGRGRPDHPRAARLLAAADVVSTPAPTSTPAVLGHCRPDARLVDTQRLDLDQITAAMVEAHARRPRRRAADAPATRPSTPRCTSRPAGSTRRACRGT